MIKTDFSNAIAASDQLLQKAESFYKIKISAESENIIYLLKLANLLRERGNLKESLFYFSKILELDPHNFSAKQMTSILGQKHTDIPCKVGFCPAPFLYIENYLSGDKLQLIWNTMLLNKSYFTDSKLNNDYKNGKLNTNIRKSSTLYEKNLDDISSWMLKKIISELPKIWSFVQMEPFEPTRIEFRLTRHGDSDFFKIHRDSGDEKHIRSRALTFVYYFHKEPKHFKGGEILLFDTDSKKVDHNTRFTKLIPKNNSIIFFPSNFYHQVTPVHMEANNFEDGRFAIHSWLHRNIK